MILRLTVFIILLSFTQVAVAEDLNQLYGVDDSRGRAWTDSMSDAFL